MDGLTSDDRSGAGAIGAAGSTGGGIGAGGALR